VGPDTEHEEKTGGGQERKMRPITHMVHYYETDKMGVTHHSNYIRWMENARIDYLEQIGCGYRSARRWGCLPR
jgi:acyl-CoA thioester hydrolase